MHVEKCKTKNERTLSLIINFLPNRAITQRRSRIFGLCPYVLLPWFFALARTESCHQKAKIRSYHGKEDDYINWIALPRISQRIFHLSQLYTIASFWWQTWLQLSSQIVQRSLCTWRLCIRLCLWLDCLQTCKYRKTFQIDAFWNNWF